MFAHPLIAEIFQQHQTALQIAGKNLWRGEAGILQIFCDMDEGPRIFVRRGRVHQDRPAIALADPKIAAERGIACDRRQLRISPSVLV